MSLGFEDQEYTISEIAKVLNEDYGCDVTTAAVRKWDNLVFSKVYVRSRGKTEARNYTNEDLQIFIVIAFLRNIGYTLDDIKIFLGHIKDYASGTEKSAAKQNLIIETGVQGTITKIKRRIDSQRKGLDLLEKYLSKMQKE